MSTSNTNPIDTAILKKDFKNRVLDGSYDPDYIVPLGVSNLGAEMLVKVRVFQGKGKNRKQAGSRVASILITDYQAIYVPALSVQHLAFGGNASKAVSPNNGPTVTSEVYLLKSVVIVCDATVVTRSLLSGPLGQHESSKTATASQTADLLDRELVQAGNSILSIQNGVAGDTVKCTVLRLV